MRKTTVFVALLVLAILPLSAQSNELLDQLLDQPQAHFGNVVYMTMAAAKLVPETATPQEAIQALQQQGWKIPCSPRTPLSNSAPIPFF